MSVSSVHLIAVKLKGADLLAPLTAASDLPHHPTLSKPFTSSTLTELTRNARAMVQKEKESLWRIKHLLTGLSGDETWIPCGDVEEVGDLAFFENHYDERSKRRKVERSIVNNLSALAEPNEASSDIAKKKEQSSPRSMTATSPTDEDRPILNQAEGIREMASLENVDKPLQRFSDEGALLARSLAPVDEDDATMEGVPGEETPPRVRTRAQAQAASEHAATNDTESLTSQLSDDISAATYFLAPEQSRPSRDMGLPAHEAEETRRILQLYIQKQEEICRTVQTVYDGLLRADRYRRLVMKWAKAEGHVGPNRDMSDGEDWYDKDEWGLTEDLKKGQDDEEDDPATTAKKTRARRQ